VRKRLGWKRGNPSQVNHDKILMGRKREKTDRGEWAKEPGGNNPF